MIFSLFKFNNLYSANFSLPASCGDGFNNETYPELGDSLEFSSNNLNIFKDLYNKNNLLGANCIHQLYFFSMDDRIYSQCDYDSRCINNLTAEIESLMDEIGMPRQFNDSKIYLDRLAVSSSTGQGNTNSLSNERLDQLENKLKNSCGRRNSEPDSMEYFNSSFISNKLVNILNEVSESCKERITHTLASDLAYLSTVEPVRIPNDSAVSIARDLTKAISEANQWVYVLDEYNSKRLDIMCKEEDNFAVTVLNLAGYVSDINDQTRCAMPSEKEDRIVDWGFNERLSSRERSLYQNLSVVEKYALRRKGFNIHVGLNINFQGENATMSDQMKQKVRGCYKEASTMMSGEGPYGHKFNLILELGDDYQGDEVPPPFDVKVSDISRSNVGEWNQNVGCSVIIHETLHILGLCDEYKERSRGVIYNPDTNTYTEVEDGRGQDNFTPLLDCRAEGPRDSIMSDDESAWRKSKTTGESLLLPAHFRAIVYPGCERYNGTYYQCSRNAYNSTVNTETFERQRCRYTPSECSDGNTQWLTE